jgi:hypothetical protein
MTNKSRLISGRVGVTDSANVSSSRYEFLDLSSAEPNLGTANNGDILIYNSENPGQRGWISQANTSAYILAQAAFDKANTGVTSAIDDYARGTANAAFIQANAAYAMANTASGGGGFPFIDLGYIYDAVVPPATFDCGALA